MNKWICIDCETTGINPEIDEILSLSIVNQDGVVLFDEMVKPLKTTYFPRATAINGISYHDVKMKPYIREFREKLISIFMEYTNIVGYNVNFDLEFIWKIFNCRLNPNIYDVMIMYSNYKKVITAKGDYKWFKLEECASDLGYVSNSYHNSLEDVKATIYCFNKLKGVSLC